MDLKGKKILVVGAKGGIGAACKDLFTQLGAEVFSTYNRNRPEVMGDHDFSLDISQANEVEQLFEQLKAKNVILDGVINCAGIHLGGPLMGQSTDDVHKVINHNLNGSIYLSQFAVKHMMRQRKGSIVHMGSVSAHRMTRGHATYSASKAGIEGLALALASEVAAKGIRVNVLIPGPTASEMLNKSLEINGVDVAQMVPQGKILMPIDIAHAAAFLLSDFSTRITGICLPVDGGYLLA